MSAWQTMNGNKQQAPRPGLPRTNDGVTCGEMRLTMTNGNRYLLYLNPAIRQKRWVFFSSCFYPSSLQSARYVSCGRPVIADSTLAGAFSACAGPCPSPSERRRQSPNGRPPPERVRDRSGRRGVEGEECGGVSAGGMAYAPPGLSLRRQPPSISGAHTGRADFDFLAGNPAAGTPAKKLVRIARMPERRRRTRQTAQPVHAVRHTRATHRF